MKMSLKIRVFALVCLLVIMSVTALFIVLRNDLAERLHEEFEGRGLIVADYFARNSVEGIIIEDEDGLSETLEKLFEIEDIVYAAIYDSEGSKIVNKTTVYVADGLDTMGEERPNDIRVDHVIAGHNDEKRVLDFLIPTFDEDNVRIGWVLVGIDLQRIDSELHKMTVQSLTLLAIFVAIALAISLLVANSIANPINEIAGAIRAVGEGDLDRSVETKRTDELGELADGFNKMARNLKLRTEELQVSKEDLVLKADALCAAHDELEVRVEERTRELAELNMKLQNDITRRKQAEKALNTSEKRDRLLAENVTDVIWTMDLGMKFTYFSPSVTNSLGYSVEEALAKTVTDILTPDSYRIAMNTFYEELDLHKKGERDPEKSVMLEFELLCKDGSTIWAELVVKFIYGSDSVPLGIIGVARDITEKKILQAEAIRAGHLAALGELAAGVAHEINNPINGVINYAELLKDEFNERGEDADIPDRIIKEGDRIANIVRNLLTFSQDGEEIYAPVNVRDILTDTLSLVDQHILNEGIILNVNDVSDLPSIGARFQEIQQVFLNILSNARYALNLKYSLPHKDKIVEITGEKINVENQDYVRTTFYDCGSGISEEIMNKICDPFYSSKPKDKGTGLGLSISHGIIKNHRGRLLFESTEGQYTKVFVDLPMWESA